MKFYLFIIFIIIVLISLDIATISKNIKEIANILREKNLWKKTKKWRLYTGRRNKC